MAARLKDKYLKEIKPALLERAGLEEYDGGAAAREDRSQHGAGRSDAECQGDGSADGRPGTDHGTEAGGDRAKKSIAAFKVREGMPIGAMVTLRGEKMYEFLDRLISTALPRVRDFKGVSTKSFDGRGNYTLGIRDQLIFPEIDYSRVDKLKGMNVTIVTTAKDDQQARALLQHFGIPFRLTA